jgi:hypothetical protein
LKNIVFAVNFFFQIEFTTMPLCVDMDTKDNNKQHSESLFPKDDIKYDVATVQAKWEAERARRRKLVARLSFIPALLLVIFVGVIIVKVRALRQPHDHDHGLEETEQGTDGVEILGYEHAKIKIDAYLHYKQTKLRNILYELVDTKPSEFRITITEITKIPQAQLISDTDYEGPSIAINGKRQYTIKGDDGKEITATFLGYESQDFLAQDLLKVVNDLHNQYYGSEGMVIELPESLPRDQQVSGHVHEHENSEKTEESEIKLELIAPQLKAKD